jgi:hypothetical protein
MTGMGADYGQSAEIGGILGRFNSVGAYGHKVVGNTERPPGHSQDHHGFLLRGKPARFVQGAHGGNLIDNTYCRQYIQTDAFGGGLGDNKRLISVLTPGSIEKNSSARLFV